MAGNNRRTFIVSNISSQPSVKESADSYRSGMKADEIGLSGDSFAFTTDGSHPDTVLTKAHDGSVKEQRLNA